MRKILNDLYEVCKETQVLHRYNPLNYEENSSSCFCGYKYDIIG